MFKQTKTADQLAAEKAQVEREARIAELKTLLAKSDYKVLPDYDNPDEVILEQRQAWREEIRNLEGGE
jgi:hypothetical protein